MSVEIVTSEDVAEQNKSLQFRLIKSFEDTSSEEVTSGNCLEISQRYGVTFILSRGSLRVVDSKALLVDNSLPPAVKNNVEVLGLSSDDSLLAIGTGSKVNIYETKAFCLQPKDVAVRCSFVVSKSGAVTSQLAWNPVDTKLIAAMSQDGIVLLIRVLDNWSIEAVFTYDPGFRCMSWSPKGKQLVVGGTNGIVQLKLDLKEAKRIGLPPDQEPVSIHWLSTLQFLVSFQPTTRDDLKIMLLTLSKTASPLFKDFGDVFLSEDFSSIKVLSKHIPQWRVHLLCSSTSSDVIIVSYDPSQPTSDLVVQEIDDRYRAALPLDHFSRGVGIYLGCSESIVVNGDNLRGCPFLVLLSQKGLVTLFRLVNEGFDSIHMPAPERLNLTYMGSPAVAAPTAASTMPATSGVPVFGNMNIGGTASENLFAISPSANALVGRGISSTTSDPSSRFCATPGKAVGAVAPSGGVVAPATRNLFSSLPTAIATPQAFGFGSSTSIINDNSYSKKTPAYGQIVETQPQGGGGDAPSLVGAPTTFQIQTSKVTPAIKPTAKAHEYKHLLEQLKQFHTRYNNFKKLHLLQSKHQLDAINQYLAKLDSHILKDLHKMGDFACDIVDTTNGQKEEVDGLYMNMQNLFTKIEFGLIAAEKNKDSKYLLLLRAQPIDPVSLAKLTKVEKSYIYLRNQLKEARRHFYYQEQNFTPLQGSVSVDFIFQTMANHALIIQNLSRQAQELRRRISEQQIQLITSTGNTVVTLDDIASGISHLKLKASKQDENNILAKPPIIYSKEKLSQLKHWGGHTLITHIPVTGAIDPYLRIAQVRKIRLNTESLGDSDGVQTVNSSSAPTSKQETRQAAFIKTVDIDTPPSNLFDAPKPLNFASFGAIPATGSQPAYVSSATSFLELPNSRLTTRINEPAQMAEQTISTGSIAPVGQAFTSAFGTSTIPSNFGSASFSATTTKSPVFGGIAQSTTNPTSIFRGGVVPTTASTTPAFNFTSSKTHVSLFGSVQATAESKTVTFPIPITTVPSTSAIITTSPTAPSSVFGSQIFGSKIVANTTTTTSFFGSAPSASLFGAPKIAEPVSIFASTEPADENLLFGQLKVKEEVPALELKSQCTSTIGDVKTDVSSIKTADTPTGFPTTDAHTSSAVTSLSSLLFGAKTSSLFGQPAVTSPFVGSNLLGSESSLLGVATTASSEYESSGSVFGNAAIFGGATQTIKTEGTTSAGTNAVTTLFGLPKHVTVTPATFSTEETVKTAEPTTASLSTPVPTVSTTADLTTISGNVLSRRSSVKIDEKGKTDSAVAESMKATSTISVLGSASEITSSEFGSMSLTTSTPPLFGNTAPEKVTSIFGGSSTSSVTTPIFGTPFTTSSGSLFGSTGSSGLFATPVTTTDIFSAAVATAPITSPSLFTAPTSTASLFQPQAAATTTSAPASSLFGTPTHASIFGTPVTTSTVTVFGNVTPAAFGSGSVVSFAATPSLFGIATTTAPTTLFGLGDIKSTGSSVFGGSPSVFGGSNSSGTDTKQIFGSPATVPATANPSVFGSPNFGSSGFGSPTTSTSSSLFGSPSFGAGGGGGSLIKPAATAFGGAQAGSVFGTPVTATTTIGAFGPTSPTSPAFGGGAVFGGSPTFGSTIKPSSFGSSSIFVGGSSTHGSTFGALAGSGSQASGATFGTTAVFGSPQPQPLQSVFGGTSTFGSPPAFGVQTQSPSLFGSATFGATGGSAFGQHQHSNTAFGGGAIFGGSPAFGSTAKTATFGASNSSSIFGGGSDGSNSSFGNMATSQPAFGATQNPGFGTSPQPSFGSFSAFSQAPAQPAFGGTAFGAGFSQQEQSQQKQPQQKSASFGGSSFSSWR